MILQKEIQNKAKQWQVPPDTVDKDYVLGHFLSVFSKYYGNELVFKGGTCLRKCYIENYRFSEDLDFSSLTANFSFDKNILKKIIEEIKDKIGVQFFYDSIITLQHNNIQKGFQVNIKYWGANHSKNQQPLPPKRWHTKIKLEVSTEELIVLPTLTKQLFHPYSDDLYGANTINCYTIYEVVSEKLRALKQRSYTAPRDFYDLYYLTNNFSKQDWEIVKPLFLKKMKYKNLEYNAPKDLITEEKLLTVERAWATSVAHQITNNHQPTSKEIIEIVAKRIRTNLAL